ncbi:MAG: prolipoprotein diacylglyceryl transferase [Candidatus Hydrogenedentes bacterium]|jgi:phosphatidylglycerol:prolipoprotein diacylglycerol transferase|nr:prolipoprotein diacylglyceryl transferase [Candidatus Hydrogenedentota bacterium]
MNETTHWVHDLDPKLLHIWGNIGISYYGLAYVLAFVFGVAMHRLMLKKNRSPLKANEEELALYAMVLGVLLGARIGYCVLYGLEELIHRPFFLFEVWQGGMSFHGGLIGVVIAALYVSRRTEASLLQFGDMITSLAPMGLLMGRIANFINGELWGKVSDISWAVIFPRSAPGLSPENILPRHPSQLYEAALEGAVLLMWLQFRYWKTNARLRPGLITGEFLFFYALFRIFCEFFREPDAALILGLSRGTFYSLFIFVAGLLFWVRAMKSEVVPVPAAPTVTETKHKKKKKKK